MKAWNTKTNVKWIIEIKEGKQELVITIEDLKGKTEKLQTWKNKTYCIKNHAKQTKQKE